MDGDTVFLKSSETHSDLIREVGQRVRARNRPSPTSSGVLGLGKPYCGPTILESATRNGRLAVRLPLGQNNRVTLPNYSNPILQVI